MEFSPSDDPPSAAQYLFSTSFQSSRFSEPLVRLDWRPVRPSGFSSAAYGRPVAWLWDYHVDASGFNSAAYGRPNIILRNRTLRLSGFDSATLGLQKLHLNDRWLLHYGFDSLRAGANLRIINRNRHVFAGNVQPPASQVSRPHVWLWDRYLRPRGFNTAQVGAHVLTHGKRYLTLRAGIAPPAVPSSAWVSHSPRLLAPRGAFLDAVGFHMVGGLRYLEAEGWDSQAFGTRVIPPPQTVVPFGYSATGWGGNHIWAYWQFALPLGFRTYAEEFRWGRAHAWNLRQYIHQEPDETGGLSPPPIVGWTSIANRNRVIGHTSSGQTPPRPGEPQVFNNARVIYPGGMAPPQNAAYYRAGMVSFRIRRLPLEGIEPPYISTWGVVYNNAAVVSPVGADAFRSGLLAHVESNRRRFRFIGAIDSAEYGLAFIADAIRTIDIERRYSIEPPLIPLPRVDLHRLYVEPQGDDMMRPGQPALSIHRRVIAPKWVARDFVGYPALRNRTPEVITRGRNSEELGIAFVRLEWRPVYPDGSRMDLFGRPLIADTRRTIRVAGRNFLNIPRPRVTQTGSPPYWPQNIIVEQSANGDGARVSRPGLNQFVIYPSVINMMRIGTPFVRSQSIMIDTGIVQVGYGHPTVISMRRWLYPSGTHLAASPGRPRLSPHTIWAVKEAPQQAKENHPVSGLHYVGETFGVNGYPPGERFGRPRLPQNVPLGRVGGNSYAAVSRDARVQLKRRYVRPASFIALRMGWHKAGDGTEHIGHFAASNTAAFGRPLLTRPPYTGPQTITARGFSLAAVPATHFVSHFHRTFTAGGFSALGMGSSRQSTPYMWQSLRVGPLLPTIPVGADMGRVGTSWVSHRVRGVDAVGFDVFRSEYDHANFHGRMKVSNAYVPVIPAQTVAPVGMDGAHVPLPNVRLRVHYIRPDGNAEQYRKGAW